MGDPAASKFVIKGDRVHTVCDCYKSTQLVLYWAITMHPQAAPV